MTFYSDAFTYAFDDHHLIVYFPWIFFVGCLWYLLAYCFEHFTARQPWKSALQRNLVLCALAFITVEMLWAASVFKPEGPSGSAAIICFWFWLLLLVVGWVNSLLTPHRA